MLQSYKDKSVLICDNGLFCELAVTLSKSFGETYFYSPWESSFPKSNSVLIGKGIPGVTRIDTIWEVADSVDLLVFPDVYFGGLQLQLENDGKRVWGSRRGEELELYRKQAKEHLKKIGVGVGPYAVVSGLSALRDYLKKHENVWVKISRTRGDMESFHSPNYKVIEPRLDELEHNLGAKKSIMEFIVEDAIDDAVELAYDGYTIDGEYPKSAMWGIEVKDKAYVGAFCPYSAMPKQIIDVNDALSDTLKRYRYRNFISPEMRISSKTQKPFIIDPCCRAGSPPSETQLVMFTNLPDILWYGGEGKCINPIPAGKYGAEVLIHSGWADKNWQAIQFPEKIRDNIKLRNLTIINGEYYVVPQGVGLPEIGAVVAVGNTLKEATDKVKEYAKQVEGYYLDIFPDSLDDAQEEIKKLNSIGITF